MSGHVSCDLAVCYTKYDYYLCGQWSQERVNQKVCVCVCVCVCVILVSPALLSHLLLVHCPLPPLQNCVCVGECVKGGGWRGGNKGKNRTYKCKNMGRGRTHLNCAYVYTWGSGRDMCIRKQPIRSNYSILPHAYISYQPPSSCRSAVTHTHTVVTLTRSVHKLPLLVTSHTALQRNGPSHSAHHPPHPAQRGAPIRIPHIQVKPSLIVPRAQFIDCLQYARIVEKGEGLENSNEAHLSYCGQERA